MSTTVYQLEHSPYCIPITQALLALRAPFEVKNISNADRREVIELTAGAYYQVPVLVHEDHVVFESAPDTTEVAHYVDRVFAGGRLFPVEFEGLQRILIPYIEDHIEGVTFRLVDPPYLRDIPDIVERSMIRRHKERKFGAGCVEAWERDRGRLTAEAATLLDPFQLMLRHKPFLFGETPVFADFALFGILGNLTYRGYNRLSPDQKDLFGWQERLRDFRFQQAESLHAG
jgi:glutathione S-transferase